MSWLSRLFGPSLNRYASAKVGKLAAFWVAVNATQPELDDKDKAFWIVSRDAESERHGLVPSSDCFELMWKGSHQLADSLNRPWDVLLFVVTYVVSQYSLKLGRSATRAECKRITEIVANGWERLRQRHFPDV